MKLIYAGILGTELPYTSLLFNCTRNQNCQAPFYVPVKQFSDIVFYADLPVLPESIQVEVLNVCDIDNVGSAVFTNYVAGKNKKGWYGVFGTPVVTPPEGVTYNCFFFKVKIVVGETTYVYYSEQMCFPVCETLVSLKGCYPNTEPLTDSFDCNGIYYGLADPDEEFLGTVNYRYFHWAYLRMASVIEQKNKLSFTVFNSKKAYKNIFSRESMLEFEFVPTFFKNVLMGIFNRGNIKIDNVEWRLSEEQEFSITDNDTKLWQLDVALAEQCKQYFGCGEDDCVLPAVPCLLPSSMPEFSHHSVDVNEHGFLTGGVSGFFIEWELYDKNSLVLIASGDTDDSVSDDPLDMNFGVIDFGVNCYFVRWRVRCGIDPDFTYSDWHSEESFGNCDGGGDPPPQFYYLCERYLCSYCAMPYDTVVVSTTNPFVVLFKYYKSHTSPTTVTLRPIATSVDVPADIMVGGARDTCTQSCGDILPDPE